jgi:hypothetical protein
LHTPDSTSNNLQSQLTVTCLKCTILTPSITHVSPGEHIPRVEKCTGRKFLKQNLRTKEKKWAKKRVQGNNNRNIEKAISKQPLFKTLT